MTVDTTTLVLNRIERARRMFNLALAAAMGLEVLFIAAMFLLVNFADKTQVLIFVGVLGSYTMIAVGLILLAIHVDRAVLRASHLR